MRTFYRKISAIIVFMCVFVVCGSIALTKGKADSNRNAASIEMPTKNADVNTARSHGSVKDGLAAFLRCEQNQFKVGDPIPLTSGIINVGSGLEWETSVQKAEENSKIRTRVWWLGNNPELQYNYSWYEVTGPNGKNVPYRGGTATLPNYTAAVADKFSVVLHHRQFVGNHYPDLRGPLASYPEPNMVKHFYDLSKLGTYKVRWGYNPWWKVGPWTGKLMSNEVQFEIVK